MALGGIDAFNIHQPVTIELEKEHAMDAADLVKTEHDLRKELEAAAAQLIELILSQPPQDLLGYFWGQLLLASMGVSTTENSPDKKAGAESRPDLTALQLIMEYIHASLACSTATPKSGALSQEVCIEIEQAAASVQYLSMLYCMVSAKPDSEGLFGEATGEVEFTAKSSWVLNRGHRHQVLEQEFYEFALAPHSDAIQMTYGASALEIASGIQKISDLMRTGHAAAFEKIQEQMEAANTFLAKLNAEVPDPGGAWREADPEGLRIANAAIQTLFKGGICRIDDKAALPSELLEDLSFARGENSEFMEPGDLAGTPLRTLPARVKPAVRIDDGIYATDPCFIRDTSYRAIQRGLLSRNPTYRDEWNKKQQEMSESAIHEILSHQLHGAAIYKSFYYPDPNTGKWVEGDRLIILDDILLHIEAKAGISAMHSPATNFSSHVRAIKGLLISAKAQTDRFLAYIYSNDEAPIYDLVDGSYVEIANIKRRKLRKIFPIGVTVESLSPIAAMCKTIPEMKTEYGDHHFISMAVDELFLLKRFLLDAGSVAHYLSVRQIVSGISDARLFDEADHLGAYLQRNRFDLDLEDQLSQGATLVMWDGFSKIVDDYFTGDRWQEELPPNQKMPPKLAKLLACLERTSSPNWLRADAILRDFDDATRNRLAIGIERLLPTLDIYPNRSFFVTGDSAIGVWLQAAGRATHWTKLRDDAVAAALASDLSSIDVIIATVDAAGDFVHAEGRVFSPPPIIDRGRARAEANATRAKQRFGPIDQITSADGQAFKASRLGRNERCWCGSGRKFKFCHGG